MEMISKNWRRGDIKGVILNDLFIVHMKSVTGER
jgi:hypothetical protein